MRRVVLIVMIGALALYFSGALAGYLWVRYARKNDMITYVDVLLLRWREVRQTMAAQQRVNAKRDAAAGDIQSAFLAYTFAVNNDPANSAGRLEAAEFLRSVGSIPLATSLLEAGLDLSPDDPELLEAALGMLTSTGRDRRALEWLRSRGRAEASNANRGTLVYYEMLAALNLGEADEARTVLQSQPDLADHPRLRALVARVRWENQERLRALELLTRHIEEPTAVFSDFSLLVSWQLTLGMMDEAQRVADRAMSAFPADPAARLLRVEVLGVRAPGSAPWLASVREFVAEADERPAAIAELGALAARRGWVGLARGVYELAVTRYSDVGLMASFYSDALLKTRRYREAQLVLAQVEAQSSQAHSSFVAQLRHRQVVTAAAVGDMQAAREYARRLGALLRNDADALEISRRHLLKLGLNEAVSEMLGRPNLAPPAAAGGV